MESHSEFTAMIWKIVLLIMGVILLFTFGFPLLFNVTSPSCIPQNGNYSSIPTTCIAYQAPVTTTQTNQNQSNNNDNLSLIIALGFFSVSIGLIGIALAIRQKNS